MSDYILARSLAEPDKPFEHWEDQYCSAFGNAAEDIKEYFHYWRDKVWESRLKPNLDKLVTAGRYGNFARGLGWSIRHNYIGEYKPESCAQYYTEFDFNRTDNILREAASKDLTAEEKRRIEQLILINQHSRLEHGAMFYRGTKGYTYSKDLLAFRRKHREDIHMSWGGIFYVEDVWGDVCNLTLVKRLENYPLPWIETPFKWRFTIDENDVGLKEKWQEKSWDDTADWKPIRINVHWSNTYESPHVELKKKLKTYDGIGWYTARIRVPDTMRDRRPYLHFGGVANSCTIYVNGKLAGTFPDDAAASDATPFAVDISDFVNWQIDEQIIVVRVNNKQGPGGIWKPVWLVSKLDESSSEGS